MNDRDMQREDGLNTQIMTALLDPREVAAVLKVSVKTVNKLAREGKLGCVQLTGRERRFTEEQIRDFVERQSQPARVDRRASKPVSSPPKKGGGKKSVGLSRTDLREEIRSWR